MPAHVIDETDKRVFVVERLHQRSQHGEARTGYGGIGERNLPAQTVIQQICKAGGRTAHQPRIVDNRQRQARKSHKAVVFKAAFRQHRVPRRVTRHEIILIGQQRFHAAAKHHVGHGRFRFRCDAFEQLRRSAGNHLHPNARAPLKFLHNRLIDFFLMRGINHQPFRFIRRVGQCRDGQKTKCKRAQQLPFHSHFPLLRVFV